MQAGQCGNQMGTKFLEVLCDEHGIGGDGGYCGGNDAQLDRIKMFYHEASGDKYVPIAVFFDLEPGVIDAVCALPLGELFRPGNLVDHTAGKIGPKTTTKELITNSSPPTPRPPPGV
jgi:tubulin beta